MHSINQLFKAEAFFRTLKYLFVTLLAIGLFSSTISASDYAQGRNIDTRILSNWKKSNSDSSSTWVAITFDINDKWHNYWVNPGTTGMATEVEWNLPKGWTIVNTYNSIPHLYENEGLVDYVHEGYALVVAKISVDPTVFDASLSHSVSASVDWLECETLCVPGHSDLSLNLSDADNESLTKWQGKIEELIESYASAIKGTYQLNSDTITFSFPSDVSVTEQSFHYFFPESPVNDPTSPQKFKSDHSKGHSITTKVTEYDNETPDLLKGWLVAYVDGNVSQAHRAELQLKTSSSAIGDNAQSAGSNFLLLILLAFAGGMILNLMPCVFPVIGLKIMGFVEQAGQDRKKIMMHGLIFTSGVLVSFWALSGLLLLLRAGGEQLGWGFQLQEPWFNYALILLMLAFALSLNGVFEFGMSAVGVGSNLQQKSGVTGSFFSGVLATVVATPCSAPFLAPALGAALALPSYQALILFTFIALGLSTPYLLLSAFPAILKVLPKPGAWMETFKQWMAFPLYGTVGYLLWALIGQIDETNQLGLFISLAVFAMGLWIFGKWGAPYQKAKTRRIAIISAILVIAGSVFMGHPKKKKEFWQPWSPEIVEQSVAEGKTVYVDFTARWCATCQLNKRVVFSSDEILEAFEKGEVVALKADWTNRDERITARLKELGKAAVPVNLVYKNGENEPVILPEVLTPGIVLEAISND